MRAGARADRPPAGSRRTRSSVRSVPLAASASSSETGPSERHDFDAARHAPAAPAPRPGRPRPAARLRESGRGRWPSSAGCSSAARSGTARWAAALGRARQLDDVRLPAAAAPAARTACDALQEGARGLAFSATQCVRRRRDVRSRLAAAPAGCPAGPVAAGDAEVERVRHQDQSLPVMTTPAAASRSASERIETPAARSSAQVWISGRPTSAVGSSDSIAVEQGDAERLATWRCRRSRTAARPAGSVSISSSRSSRKRTVHRHQCAPARSRSAWHTTATAVWNTTLRPLIARNCSTARAWLPGLPIGATVEIGDLVGADDDRIGDAAPPPHEPWPAPAAWRARPAPRRRAASRRPAARRTSKGRRRRSSSSRR